MSASPPKEAEVEQEPQSHDEEGPMERDPHTEQAPGLSYEFEVKEQDRWLPIANGWCYVYWIASTSVVVSRVLIRLSYQTTSASQRKLDGQDFKDHSEIAMPRNPASSVSPSHRHGSKSHNIASDANIRNFAPVARIMKTALPDNAKIAKEAKECMQECVSEFISFITSEGSVASAASEKCQQEKRKTVNGEDILFAMTSLGFENYAEALKIYLSKYREVRHSLQGTAGYHDKYLNYEIDGWYETQSTRGENQNRPSSGYGAGGPVVSGGGATSTNAAPSSSSTIYTGHAENNNNLLGTQGIEGTEQDPGAYGQVYPGMVGTSHNGDAY
ncbi:MAG: hypothetical protein M1834_001671 [Cirrosporium novae-zelandiae]|nr:MAG: hypothetical protein M1834_001671 [Cirrosporium novae-zelandiae]